MKIYDCIYIEQSGFPSYDSSIWEEAAQAVLVETKTGLLPKQRTIFSAMWDSESLLIRFICQDDFLCSDYKERDSEIYNQDVVELFITSDDIYHYKELEQSPYNVQFDADIIYHDPENIDIAIAWDAQGWETKAYYDENNKIIYYVWKLPFAALGYSTPRKGDEWRFNAYRIDRGRDGVDEYSAFNKTGKIEFHVPECFGILRFI